MTAPQITLIQIDNYGPWTVTPEPRPEPDLQTLQSRLYADPSQSVGRHDGYVFFTRFDNMIAVTNGMDLEPHRRIQASIRNRYPVTISLTVATSDSPASSLTKATATLQDAGSAQDADRREILQGEPLSPAERTSEDVEIAHFDVNNVTGEYTDELNAFESFRRINRGYSALVEYLYDEYDSLSFFIGGDNVISVTAGLNPGTFRETITHVRETADLELKVGVGRSATAQSAGMNAKWALERYREENTRVAFGRRGGEGETQG